MEITNYGPITYANIAIWQWSKVLKSEGKMQIMVFSKAVVTQLGWH